MTEIAPAERTARKNIAPDFYENLCTIENMARAGVETYTGRRRLEFRIGMEIEFMPIPARDLCDLEDVSSLRGMIINPELLDESSVEQRDYSDEILEGKERARALVCGLEPQDTAQEQIKNKWLDQINDFSIVDLINFELYAEFSTPTLCQPDLTKTQTLEELDELVNPNDDEQKNWLEFRFGTSTGGEGYYDSPTCCEIRISPCAPSELVSRQQIINEKMIERANSYGIVLATDHINKSGGHMNISVYELDLDGKGNPLIKCDEDADTSVIVGGILQGHSDGLNLAYFDSKTHSTLSPLRVGNSRSFNLVIKDSLIENRAAFSDVSSAANWMVSSALFGLIVGKDGIDKDNIPIIGKQHEIETLDGYNPSDHSAIRVALETCLLGENPDGIALNHEYFSMDKLGTITVLFNKLFGKDLETNTISHDLTQRDYRNIFMANIMVFHAMHIGSNNDRPYVRLPEFMSVINGMPEQLGDKQELTNTITGDEDLQTVVKQLNEKLRNFKFVQSQGYIGRSGGRHNSTGQLKSAIKNSDILPLFLGENISYKEYIAWLKNRRREFH